MARSLGLLILLLAGLRLGDGGHRLARREARVGGSALLREVEAARGAGGRQSRGLFEMFVALADMRSDTDSLIRGGNNTGMDNRGIFDFVADVATSLLGGASDKNDAPVLIPNHCW
jgi:hypothetical protein